MNTQLVDRLIREYRADQVKDSLLKSFAEQAIRNRQKKVYGDSTACPNDLSVKQMAILEERMRSGAASQLRPPRGSSFPQQQVRRTSPLRKGSDLLCNHFGGIL